MNRDDPRRIAEEISRIRSAYRDKDESPAYRAQYLPLGRVAFGYQLQRLKALGDLLRTIGCESLSGLHILEVLCGTGGFLGLLPSFGADPQKLCGVDLMPERLAQARTTYPQIRFDLGPGDALPVPDARYDLVIQSLVFSSIHLGELRQRLAEECMRVLKPGGFVFWCDMLHLVDTDRQEALDPRPLFPDWPIRTSGMAWAPKPSEGMPRRLWRYTVGRVADLFALKPTHLAALSGPKPGSSESFHSDRNMRVAGS